MDCSKSFDYKNSSELKKDENDEPKSIECIADKMSFKAVWQKSEVNMELVNQFMNQLNIYDDNEFGDQTPSNISALISSSFPSGDVSFNDMDFEEFGKPQFISSTPHPLDSSKAECLNFDVTAFQEFNRASPIYSPRKRRIILTKRKLMFSIEDIEEKNFKVLKV